MVQKFVGDAVTAVFGVPALHEDDAERAVRAGLRLVEQAGAFAGPAGGASDVRVGVHSGEALVSLDIEPASGEGLLTGDVLTVAARLQSLAPATGVVVSESTHELTAESFQYEALETAAPAGVAPALPVWLAKAPRRHTGGRPERTYLTPLVGRETELSFLEALFEKAAGSSSPQVALIVGEPGIGKSRLVAELFGHVQSRGDRVTWCQGRCLPYGEGVTYWALGEVFKAQAGILETDDLATVEAKLGAIVPEGPDREWLRNRLRALLGLEAPAASREENSTAWLRLLEELAAAGPAIVAIEDLHWADEALLAFIEYVAGNVAEVPLLVIATARPELFERQPSFAAAIGRVNRIALEPLSSAETERLVAGLLETARIPGEVRDTVVARSEGNPFYAEESVRLLRDRAVAEASHLLDSVGAERRSREGETAPMPGSVQAVIAARLDTLPPQHKAVIADAAVIGSVFWSGAVAALGESEPGEVDEALRDLIAKQLVHRVRESSMQGESEFAFGHALARDVAYGQLPRVVRARKHAAAAAWIEGKAGERAEDLAEILAHHYGTAHDLARAAGDDELADSVLRPAVRLLTLAGDRALDVAAAESQYARALQLAGADGPERPVLLVRWGKAVIQRGRPMEALAALEEAIRGLRAAGETRAAALAQMELGYALADVDAERWHRLQTEAVASLEAEGPSPELLVALNDLVGSTWGQADPRVTLGTAERAVAVAERLGLPPDPRAIAYRGCARCDMGDAGGLDDLRLALEMVRIKGAWEEAGTVYWAVGAEVYMCEGFRSTLETLREGLEYARRRGDVDTELQLRGLLLSSWEPLGEWDAVLSEALAVEPLLEAASSIWMLAVVRFTHLQVLVQRGRAAEAEQLASLVARDAHRESGHMAAACATAAAAARLAAGERDGALELLVLADAAYRRPGGFWWCGALPLAVRTAAAAGDGALVQRLAESIDEPLQPITRHAVATAQAFATEARGEHEAATVGFADTAARWHEFELPYEEAHALLGQGRCLVALGRAAEAAPVLEQAREIFERLGAKPALAEAERLMASRRGVH